MIRGVIFDLDGTLIDSDPYWKEADKLLAEEYPFPFTDKFGQQLSGLGIKESALLFIKTFNLNETPESFMKKRMTYLYRILLNKIRLMPYAEFLLQKLKKEGYVLALATAGHSEEMTRKIIDKASLSGYFNYVISGLEVKHSKPAPDIYLKVASEMILKSSQCIAVEDTVNGILSAKNAGMKVIGVNINEKIREKIKNVGADFVYKNLDIPLLTFK